MNLFHYQIIIAELCVQITSEVPGFEPALTASYGRYLVKTNASPTTDLNLTIERMETADIPSSARPGFGKSRIWSAGSRVRVFVPMGEPTDIFIMHVRPYLTTMIARILWERQRVVMLHASACQDADGQAVLFTGPSGAGKTSSTLTRVADGGRFMSNDILFLRPGIVWQALSMPQPPTVGYGFTKAMARAFPDFSTRLPKIAEGEGKKEVSLSMLPQGDLEVPLKAIIFVQPNNALSKPYSEHCPQQECFARLMGEIIFPIKPGYLFEPEQVSDGYERLSYQVAALAREVPATLFTWTENPAQNARHLNEILAVEETYA